MEAYFWDLRWSHTDGTHLYLFVKDEHGFMHQFDIYKTVLYETDRYRMTDKFFRYVYERLKDADFTIDPDTHMISWDLEL